MHSVHTYPRRVHVSLLICFFRTCTYTILVPRAGSLFGLPSGTLCTFMWSGKFHRHVVILFRLSELRFEMYFDCLDFAGNARFQHSPEAR